MEMEIPYSYESLSRHIALFFVANWELIDAVVNAQGWGGIGIT